MDVPDLSRYKRWVVLTGAGVSVASGLPTWRGAAALLDASTLQKISSADTLAREPQAVWQLYGAMREQAMPAMPNRAHLALAQMEAQVVARVGADGSFLLVTQNIDGLHQKAGSRNVVEFHGNVGVTRCTNPACDLPPYPDTLPHLAKLPCCPRCGQALRPDVVLFGEQIPALADWQAKRALRDCDLLLVIGSSGHVAPAANFARSARYVGAHSILLTLEPGQDARRFDRVFYGKAEEWLPKWAGMD
jgi:NAD-dependent deacetylase